MASVQTEVLELSTRAILLQKSMHDVDLLENLRSVRAMVEGLQTPARQECATESDPPCRSSLADFCQLWPRMVAPIRL